MPELIRSALERLPSAMRQDAIEATFMTVAGYSRAEIGVRLELNAAEVTGALDALAAGVVESCTAAGYSTAETIRLLGVPTAAVLRVGTNNGTNGNGSLIPREDDH